MQLFNQPTKPTILCGMVCIGLPACVHGQGKFCLSKDVCEHQMIDNKTYTPEAERRYTRVEHKVLQHAREVSDQYLSDTELDPLIDILRNENI